MAKNPAFEAKAKFGELCDRVMVGEKTVVTRHEKPMAHLISEGTQSLEGIRRAAEGLDALQKEIAAFSAGRRVPSWKEFKSFVEEGR